MHGFWLFLHVFGFVLWLGGGLSAMVGTIATKHHTPAERLAVFTAFGAVARHLIAPGALLVVVTGIGMMLGTELNPQGGPPGLRLSIMMGAGLIGALHCHRDRDSHRRQDRPNGAGPEGRDAGSVCGTEEETGDRGDDGGDAGADRPAIGYSVEVVVRLPVLQFCLTGHSGHFGFLATHITAPSSMIA